MVTFESILYIHMKFKTHPDFVEKESSLVNVIKGFNCSGEVFGNGDRNKIKLFDLDGITINIKSFKIPHFINKIAYRYFRKSKAKRSFEFATQLMEMQIGTPKPIAFYENYDAIGLKESYYACEHLGDVFEFRALVDDKTFVDREVIIRQFTQFTFEMHQKGIEFLDHSPGNTLIKKGTENKCQFFLVDLNRMNFHTVMDFNLRMKNFNRLTPHKEMIAIMSNEYAKLYTAKTEAEIFEKMWGETQAFQEKFARKKRLKKKIKFWKK